MFKCSFCKYSSSDEPRCPFPNTSTTKKENCEKAMELMVETLKNIGRG
jgi:hypothetical protein